MGQEFCVRRPRQPVQNPFERYFAAPAARGEIHMTTEMKRITQVSGCAAGILALLLGGCTTKKYVRSQTAPLIQHTNELDDQTATNNRNLKDLDERTTTGINKAQSSADTAQQNAQQASTASAAAASRKSSESRAPLRLLVPGPTLRSGSGPGAPRSIRISL